MALADDYEGVFSGMKSDADFSSGIASMSSAWFNTQRVMGPSGSGMAPFPVGSSPGPGVPIIQAGTQTKSDAGIAKAIANGVHAIALSGTSGKVFSGSPAPLEAALVALFAQMFAMTSYGGDRVFAEGLATEVMAYASAGGMF